jgi:hypothetical protein
MAEFAQHPVTALAAWLADTALSRTLQTVEWLVPAIQTAHILAVAIVISAVLMLALAAFGLHGREQALTRSVARFAPAIRYGLPVLLLSGALMITAEPDRALPNPAFQLKMALLVAAVALTYGFARAVRGAAASVAGSGPASAVRVAAAGALVFWVAVLVAGRWIAYTLSR